MRPLDGGLGPNPVYSFWHLDASPSFCVVDSRKRPRGKTQGERTNRIVGVAIDTNLRV